MRLEPRTPGFRVKHFTTEPRGTLSPVSKWHCAIWNTKKLPSANAFKLDKAKICLFSKGLKWRIDTSIAGSK